MTAPCWYLVPSDKGVCGTRRFFTVRKTNLNSYLQQLIDGEDIKGAAAGIGAFGLAQLARTADEDVRSGSGLSPERVADLGMAVQEVSGFIAQLLPDEAD